LLKNRSQRHRARLCREWTTHRLFDSFNFLTIRGADGITVNAIAPGFTRTPGTIALGTSYRGISSEQLFETLAQRQAIPRPAKSSDLVGTLSFLASDDAEFLTAQTLYVDGGLVRAS
jgi:3-oxoacyl-[acyl-carrier protein] reductase/(S)-1-phenylethanol dehydrogenase